METKTNEIANAVVLTEEQKALVEKVKSEKLLNEQEELALFGLPVGKRKEALLAYSARYVLNEEAELKLFDLPKEERDEILSAYLSDIDDYRDFLYDLALEKFNNLSEEEKKAILKK